MPSIDDIEKMINAGQAPEIKPDGEVVLVHGARMKDLSKEIEQFVSSTGDGRTANNIMRHEYRVLSDAEKRAMLNIKDAGVGFVTMCDSIGTSRELSLAKTKMEEAVMWAVKHITK